MPSFEDLFSAYIGNGVGISPNNRAFALKYDPTAILNADKFNTLNTVSYLNKIGDPRATQLMAELNDRMKMQGPPKPLPYDQYLDLGRTQLPMSNGKPWLY